MIIRKSHKDLDRIADAGSIVARCHELLRSQAKPGTTTGELDAIAEAFIRDEGGVPTFKGYLGFTGSICVSPNEMVVHGIPGPYALRDRDVLSVDIGVTLKGWVADSALTFVIGDAPAPADVQRFLETCRLSLFDAIEQCVPGRRLSDIGHAVQTRVEGQGYGVIRELVGHGVGRKMHEAPQIANYGEPGKGPELKPGTVLAIEPMITMGHHAIRPDEHDGWSIYSADGSLTAHFEHTVAVTEGEPRVLTRHEGHSPVDDVVV